MKKRISCMVLLCILLISFPSFAMDFSPEEANASVVMIRTFSGTGSGFFIKENLILTNAHVADQDTVTVDLYSGESLSGRVTRRDTEADLALVEVDGTATAFSFYEGEVAVGEDVYVIGAPEGMAYTLAKGIVSSKNRSIGEREYIQIDAAVNPGNSGGPLLNEKGEVLGVVSLKASQAEGIGFAIPVKDVYTFLEDIPVEESPTEASETENEAKNEAENKPGEKGTVIPDLSRIRKGELYTMIGGGVLFLGIVITILVIKHRIRKKEEDPDFEIEIIEE